MVHHHLKRRERMPLGHLAARRTEPRRAWPWMAPRVHRDGRLARDADIEEYEVGRGVTNEEEAAHRGGLLALGSKRGGQEGKGGDLTEGGAAGGDTYEARMRPHGLSITELMNREHPLAVRRAADGNEGEHGRRLHSECAALAHLLVRRAREEGALMHRGDHQQAIGGERDEKRAVLLDLRVTTRHALLGPTKDRPPAREHAQLGNLQVAMPRCEPSVDIHSRRGEQQLRKLAVKRADKGGALGVVEGDCGEVVLAYVGARTEEEAALRVVRAG